MTYHQITLGERYALGALRQQGLSAAAIARALGRHRSTIGREVRRNRKVIDGCYRPPLADLYARGRRSRSRRNRRFSAADWARVQALVREDWSPEQVAGRLRRQGVLAISHETIYRYIWADKRAGGRLYQHRTSTYGGPASGVASATGATTAAAACGGSARSARARPPWPPSSGIGRRPRCSARGRPGPAC